MSHSLTLYVPYVAMISSNYLGPTPMELQIVNATTEFIEQFDDLRDFGKTNALPVVISMPAPSDLHFYVGAREDDEESRHIDANMADRDMSIRITQADQFLRVAPPVGDSNYVDFNAAVLACLQHLGKTRPGHPVLMVRR